MNRINICEVSLILNEAGKLNSYQHNYIKEDFPPYENYYELEKDGDKWLYNLVMLEKENKPYIEKVREFDEEQEALKFFLLNRLASFYFSTIIKAFMLEHDELEIGGSSFDENKFYEAMSIIGIPSAYFIKGNLENTNRSIVLTKNEADLYIVSFVDGSGNIIQSTIPINYQSALFITFRKVYLLYLFESFVYKMLEKHDVQAAFTERDINTFLT